MSLSMLFDTAAAVLDWMGVIVFAVTGGLVASRKQMDIVGFALLGTATGIGGGSLRDVLLGQPVFWVHEPAYLVTCLMISALTFFAAHLPQSRYVVLLWLDALGLALFCVTGAERALLAGTGPTVAVAMGVITATFGGVIRDVLGDEIPVVLTREIYVTAALCGAAVFVTLSQVGLGREAAIAAGLGAGLAVRGAALHWGWSLPRYHPRPGRTREEIERLR